jgi:hypothetical protein
MAIATIIAAAEAAMYISVGGISVTFLTIYITLQKRIVRFQKFYAGFSVLANG